ncbi:MAG: histidinol-phosphate transaminase [Deltaproteobacteria bacterium]|nr:histidinol-phosphate transaminase [Candidatus Anaeroferrophillus wilburensis]MBN2888025.1 histidinol-phosphate transaminase [Deltaproteobacteria bacterium]
MSNRHVRPAISTMAGYTPGFQPPRNQQIIKLNTNENPYPPSPMVAAAIRRAVESCDRFRLYPDPVSDQLRQTAARVYGLNPEQVLAGNGSDDLLRILLDTFVDPGESVGFFEPSYSLYPVLTRIRGGLPRAFPLNREKPEQRIDTTGIKLFYLTTPHAPYGFSFSNGYIKKLADCLDGILVADEAYVDFAEESALGILAECKNLVVTRSFSKSYALAAMRVGLAFAAPEIIVEMDKARDSYNLDLLAQEAATAALLDESYLKETVGRVKKVRQEFGHLLAEHGFTVFPSRTNFIFTIPPAGFKAADLYQFLADHHILVRYFAAPPLDQGIRISIGTTEQMDQVIQTISNFLVQEGK